VTAPLRFDPVFMERVWGGRRLAERYGKDLPAGAVFGESWELVDRPEAQSVVAAGHELAGRTLGSLWRSPSRDRLFGRRAAAVPSGDPFPLLVKLLDCEQTLSVQVHPPAGVATDLGGEPKTEMWVILDATPDAVLYVGLRAGVTREAFERSLAAGEDVSACLQRVEVEPGDAMFLPSGRIHAIGAGNLIAEIQQNSDTTYRVFDFNRLGLDGVPRPLHVAVSLASIDWDDVEPPLVQPVPLADGGADDVAIVHDPLFEVDRLVLAPGAAPRPAAPDGECAVVIVTAGSVVVDGRCHGPGVTLLIPADAGPTGLLTGDGEVLRTLIGTGTG
jgi:mannose-6-phosphate isomerase